MEVIIDNLHNPWICGLIETIRELFMINNCVRTSVHSLIWTFTFHLRYRDQYQYLGNYPPTPPLTQH